MVDQMVSLEALSPQEMAIRAQSIGVKKAGTAALDLFLLAVLAGAYIALGAIFATTLAAGTSGTWPYGVVRLLMGLAFSLGLILVIVGGAELFTGNILIIIAWLEKKVSTSDLLRNWVIVFLGNFIGSVATAGLIFFSRQYTFGNGAVGKMILSIASTKSSLGFIQAVALGILCNALVCLAVWLTYSARTTVDKIVAILFPITAFVAAGFEHSVANMYFIPIGIFVRQYDPTFALKTAAEAKITLDSLTWSGFILNNLIPVTIGNIIGGAVLVGLMYWFVYLRGKPST